MADLKTYLAQKYMTGARADAILAKTGPVKKKKRKAKADTGPDAPSGSSSMIRDEDSGWADLPQTNEDEDDLAGAVVVADRSFKKRKVGTGGGAAESNWVTVQEGIKIEKEDSPPPPADEEPVVVGGLVRAGDKKRFVQPEAHEVLVSNMTAEEIALAQQTVYRDSSGKKIDMKAAKAEAARMKRLRDEKEAEKMQWGKGLVQREEEEAKKQEMERQKGKGFRRADDVSLNEGLKSKEIWNDPAAAFLTKKKAKGSRRPEYNGPPPPPNRFGIKPGYRWDGVDRSTGFEKKLFQSQNAKKRKCAESYQWSVDDM